MPKKKRNYYRYELKDGRKKVYIGITKDPERRREEHTDKKRFSKMNVVRPAVTKDTAEKWEEEQLKKYRSGHSGKNPRYNNYKK